MNDIRITAQDDLRHRALLLVAVAIASIGLWQTQTGSMILYPFTILATWFHEMGHGLTTLLTGSGFEELVIHPDGSGYAVSVRPADGSRFAGALISAGGPMGPAIAGGGLLMASRTPSRTRQALAALGVLLIVSTIVWVRSTVGWLVLPAMGAGILLLAMKAGPRLQRLTIQILGVQAGISVWRQFDYLFSDGGLVGGRPARSDTAAITDALLLPYWFWGGAISVAIMGLLTFALRHAFKP